MRDITRKTIREIEREGEREGVRHQMLFMYELLKCLEHGEEQLNGPAPR